MNKLILIMLAMYFSCKRASGDEPTNVVLLLSDTNGGYISFKSYSQTFNID